MKKGEKKLGRSILFISLGAVLTVLLAFSISVYRQTHQNLLKWEAWQLDHLEKLSAQDAGFTPPNVKDAYETEKKRTGMDVEKAIEQGARFNQLRGIITHNSYKRELNSTSEFIHSALGTLNDFNYIFPSLTEQLNTGVMGLELDVYYRKNNGGTQYVFFHMPVVDMNSSAYDARLALREIAYWSKANPKHLPIVLLIEPKSVSLAPFNIYGMDDQSILDFDALLREELGDSLLSPKDMLRSYPDFGAMRTADDWPLLEDTLGKVIALMHPGELTPSYVETDESLHSQAMFPAMFAVDSEHKQASFILDNNATENTREDLIEKKNLVVRSRLDKWPNHDLDRYINVMESGAQWLSTDYPKCIGNEYVTAFEGGSTAVIEP